MASRSLRVLIPLSSYSSRAWDSWLHLALWTDNWACTIVGGYLLDSKALDCQIPRSMHIPVVSVCRLKEVHESSTLFCSNGPMYSQLPLTESIVWVILWALVAVSDCLSFQNISFVLDWLLVYGQRGWLVGCKLHVYTVTCIVFPRLYDWYVIKKTKRLDYVMEWMVGWHTL